MTTGGAPSGGVAAIGGTSAGGTPTGGKATGGGSTGGRATGGSSAGGASSSTGCGNTNLPAACNTSTTGPCTISVNGTTRQYFVVLPTSFASSTPYPLVFAWHGLNGTAQQLLAGGFGGGSGGFYGVRTNMPNAVYVVPQGLPSGMSDSGTDYGWPDTNGRDIAFLKAMISSLESNYCIDQDRLFSTGMSYGGMMSDRIGCQMPDVFRALGVMSGSLWGGQSCVNHPIAAWFTHGTADTVVAISGDETARDQFIKVNGCDTTNTQTETLDANTTCTIYNVCTAGNYPVEWCPVNGEGHTIPSWAGAQIAKFFLQF
jgi:poly(3-hydroxybutyrate) depolymerase